MRSWKFALACAVVAAVLAFTIVHNRAGSGEHVAGAAAPRHDAVSSPPRQQANRPTEKDADADYGWGPVRAVDW